MALNLPDWKTTILAAERRLSPRLEQAVRTDVFLDAMTVANSLNRLAHRSADAARFSIAGALDLPTSRQIAQLQCTFDRLVESRQSESAGSADGMRRL
jgi:hypothetical protein